MADFSEFESDIEVGYIEEHEAVPHTSRDTTYNRNTRATTRMNSTASKNAAVAEANASKDARRINQDYTQVAVDDPPRKKGQKRQRKDKQVPPDQIRPEETLTNNNLPNMSDISAIIEQQIKQAMSKFAHEREKNQKRSHKKKKKSSGKRMKITDNNHSMTLTTQIFNLRIQPITRISESNVARGGGTWRCT